LTAGVSQSVGLPIKLLCGQSSNVRFYLQTYCRGSG
jgi:hypothetical protein